MLEILQLVNHRDLLLADTHIQELERECELLSCLPTTATTTFTPPHSPSIPLGGTSVVSASRDDSLSSNVTLDSSRRKAKDVELLYEALQREMWDVVRESLRQPSAGPNLGLVVLVIQQEDHADAAWALRQESKWEREGQQGWASQRPRRLKVKWRQAVAEAADWSLPHQVDTQAGQLASYLERLRSRMVDDLDAARRNAVSIYPEDFAAFQVYVESYHQAVAKRLRTVTSGPLQITDVYALLDWFFNIYNRSDSNQWSLCAAKGPQLGFSVANHLQMSQGCSRNHLHKLSNQLWNIRTYSAPANCGQAGGRLHQHRQSKNLTASFLITPAAECLPACSSKNEKHTNHSKTNKKHAFW